MVIGYESAEHLRMVLYGLRNPETKKENIVQAMDAYKIVMMTDCKSLEQHLKQPGLHTVMDKRLAIDLSSDNWYGDFRARIWEIRWFPSAHQSRRLQR